MRMRGGRRRRRAEEAVARLGVPARFGLDELVACVARSRGTTIEVAELPEITPEEGLFGLWLSTQHGDYILHAPAASELHRRQIVLHELAHMILGHDLREDEGGAKALFPDIGSGAVLRVLARGHEDSAMEREAEELADVLARSMRQGRRSSAFSEVFG